MRKPNIAIIGTPRSGSSYLTKLLVANGWNIPYENDAISMGSYNFNPDGYFESTQINLLNDQLIRFTYGQKYSFLNPPPTDSSNLRQDFYFDLDETTLEIPDDYLKNIYEYTGQSWDVWGITRMLPGEKWHKAYSRNNLASYAGISASKEKLKNYLSQSSGLVVKDSRLTFTLNEFSTAFDKIIILTRGAAGLVQSIRGHYGTRMFNKGEMFDEFKWVSNHFNYKIPDTSYEQFAHRYEDAYSLISRSNDCFRINQSDLSSKDEISRLSRFLGFDLNTI
jgi:hypothetical protein